MCVCAHNTYRRNDHRDSESENELANKGGNENKSEEGKSSTTNYRELKSEREKNIIRQDSLACD